MALSPLLPEHRPLLERYLAPLASPLSAYSFAAHALWRDHFNFYWTIDQDHFLLFAEYDRFLYMPLPPLGAPDPKIVADCFDEMDRRNLSEGVSRIENIAEGDLSFYQKWGLKVEPKAPEYLYPREALADLKGDRYKSQRWSCNRFEKRYRPIDRPYHPSDRDKARGLFQKWAKLRAARSSDPFYRGLLEDSAPLHARALAESESLGLTGRVVEVSGEIVGYTFGFPLNRETFCVVIEVADPTLPGAASFLFRNFCRALGPYIWINTMDDSGLENLKKSKRAYHPCRELGCYLARRY
ncbi:MAG TPA: phosphatidylglycerol lysyltransferase domain-containing protein [Candidatus Manganitrophaceae bacterium]